MNCMSTKTKLSEKSEKLDELTNKEERMQETLDAKEAKIEELLTKISDQSEEIEQHKTTAEEMVETTRLLKESIDNLQSENSQKNCEVDTLNSEVNYLRNDLAMKDERHGSEIDDLKDSYDNRIKSIQSRARTYQEKVCEESAKLIAELAQEKRLMACAKEYIELLKRTSDTARR